MLFYNLDFLDFNYDISVEVTHADSRSNPAVLHGHIKFDPEFKIIPAPDIQLIMAKRSPAEQTTINHLHMKLVDDETNNPISYCQIGMAGPDSSYIVKTDSYGECYVDLGLPLRSRDKLSFDIKFEGYLPITRTEELGYAAGDTASKVFRLIRNEFEFSGKLKSNKPGEFVKGGRLVLMNPETTINIYADKQGRFSQIMKKHQQPDKNSYTLYIYSKDHFFFIKNIDFLVPRIYKQNREFVVPFIQKGAKVILYNVFFEQYRYLLTLQTYPELMKSAAYIREHPNVVLEIGGHTSSPGSASYNLWLSERRAEAARDFYIGLGIPDAQLITKGYGEVFPIANNVTRDGQTQNRRVELKIVEFRH